jgi:hypothetical protein
MVLKTNSVELFLSCFEEPVDFDLAAAVTLTYNDEEGDKVVIHDMDDLADAMMNSSNANRTLKIMAAVEKKVVHCPMSESATQTRVETKSSAPPSPESPKPTPSLPIQDVVEAFAGVIVSAVQGLKTQAASRRSVPPFRVLDATPIVTECSDTADLTSQDSTACAMAAAIVDQADGPQEGAAEAKHEPRLTKEEPHPFIHGRHTCDGCLTTPIVGLRFHAVNLPDYDLCEACKGNYKGSEIHFEEAELGRFVVRPYFLLHRVPSSHPDSLSRP